MNFRAGLKELAIVFFGVFLGLMADGWREQRSLVGEKNEALRSIRDDLSADAEFQRDYLERVRASAAAGFALAEALTGPDAWSGESAASRIDALISGRPLVTTGQG